MFHRNPLLMSVSPVILIGALLVVLAPACTMPGCGAFVGLVTMLEQGCPDCTDEYGCEDYMMVDDTPDGVAAVSSPVVAVIQLPETPAASDAYVSVSVLAESSVTPEYDPLGVRIRI